ncbi:MAG TPA: hypothetical protein VJT78_03805 [Candidatus Dormibacteraeota bacterium]|nr:hypothetical protein [Candidatus Dormibacteraeota bacterium]
MATATITVEATQALESRRRSLLAESDALLDDLELLRLADRSEAPPRLREAIQALQVRLGRRNPPVPPATLDAVHDLVFAVQQRLMAANPNNPRPNGHSGRPGGQPIVTLVVDDRKWKVLTLPSPTSCADEDEWIALVECTVERGWDRWCYAQQQAVRAARERFKPLAALAVARAAWANYWDLVEEAELLKGRLRSRRVPAPRQEILSALRR